MKLAAILLAVACVCNSVVLISHTRSLHKHHRALLALFMQIQATSGLADRNTELVDSERGS